LYNIYYGEEDIELSLHFKCAAVFLIKVLLGLKARILIRSHVVTELLAKM